MKKIEIIKKCFIQLLLALLLVENGIGQIESDVPFTILSPVVGDIIYQYPPTNCPWVGASIWGFCQHQTGGHHSTGGINQANDHFAYDCNLSNNLDAGKDVYPVEDGVISHLSGWAGNGWGQLLIKHVTNGKTWYSGYLHMSNITSKKLTEGTFVSKFEVIGKINSITSSSSSISEHLHFAVYYKNTNNKLISANRTFTVRLLESNTPSLNQSLPIYAGTIQNPKNLNIYFKSTDIPSSNFSVSYFNIDIPNGPLVTIPASQIYSLPSTTVDGVTWLHFGVNMAGVANNPNFTNNGFRYDVGFDVISEGQTKHFHGDKQLYFIDATTLTDIGTTSDKWYDRYVKAGVDFGLFRGMSPSSAAQVVSFNPSQYLTKPHAAVVVVNAAVRLGLMNINTSGEPYTDVPPTNQYFPYVQTLKNYGITGTPANNLFGINENINQARFCKWVAMALDITSSDIDQSHYGSLPNISYIYPSDPALSVYVDILAKTPSIRAEPNLSGEVIIEPIFSVYDFSSFPSSQVYPSTVVCDGNISRADMAKIITLAYEKKKDEVPNPQQLIINKNEPTEAVAKVLHYPNEFVSYGQKFHNAAITASSTPLSVSQQVYSVSSSGSLTLIYNQASSPQHYYWSMLKNGANLTSNNSAHSSVTFTAPSVNVPTQWKLYTYTANTVGKAVETIITINVGGQVGGSSNAPTLQANSLTLYGATTSSITASWTRGNGQNCIVTCTEVSANPQDTPDPEVTYTGNSNFQIAPSIYSGSETKIVYTGTGSSVQITGLNPNTQYRISVYEYNGTASPNVFYNYTGFPSSIGQTINPSAPQPPVVSIDWSPELPFTVNSTINFTGTASNYDNLVWSVQGNATILSGQGTLNTTVSFGNAGNISVTLTASNTSTGLSNTANLYTQILSQTHLQADLKVENAQITSAVLVNQNILIQGDIKNQGADYPSNIMTWTKFYLSDNNTLETGDYYFSASDVIMNNAIPSQTSEFFNQSIQLPSWVTAGNYFLIVQADGAVNVTESNELNNTVAIPFTVTNSPCDYFISSFSISPSTLSSGQTFTPNINVQNTGSCNSNLSGVQFYYSTDNILSTDDIAFGSYYFQFSPSGLKTPNTILNGNYFIIAAVDFDFGGNGYGFDQNLESNESNNYMAFPITISNPGQPTIQTNNFEISSISNNSLTFSWQNGNGQERLAVACKNNLPFLPNDNVNYTPNSTISLAPLVTSVNTSTTKVVYTGSGNSVMVSGLETGNDYMFSCIERNLPGPNYLHPFLNVNLPGNNYAQKYVSAFVGNETINGWKKLTNYISSSVFDPICFVNDSVGFHLYSGNYISKTSNKGKTWASLQLTNQELYSLFFINENKGWVVGGNGFIARTINAGATWSNYSLSGFLQGIWIYDVEFVDENIGFIVGKNPQNEGVVLKSTNGGLSWQTIFTNPSALYTISAKGTTVCVGGDNRRIFKSSNMGYTWGDVTENSSLANMSIRKIQFVDPMNGWASYENNTFYGGTKFLKTTNGGTTWNVVIIPNTQTGLSDFHFVNENLGYAISSNWFGKTSDGGITWELTPSNNAIGGQNIEILSGNKIIVTNHNTGMFINETGGLTNNVSLESIEDSSYCAGSTIEVPYTITGMFDQNNLFNIELSDENGSFNTSNVIYSFSNSGSGTLNVSIPQNTVSGTNYRLRIMSSLPANFIDTSNVFSVVNSGSVSVTINPEIATICPDSNILFTALPVNEGATPEYTWKKNGEIVGNNSASFSSNSLVNEDVVWVELVSNQFCSSNIPSISNPVSIQVTQIDPLFIQAIDNILAASTNENVQWYLNGQVISGANSQFYEATETGFYQFSSSIAGCTSLSDLFNLNSIVSVSEIAEDNQNLILLYPNPTSNSITIAAQAGSIQSISLFDLNGKQLSTKQVNGQETQLDVSHLEAGIYLVRIEMPNGETTMKRFMKK